jgi:anion-transporting  ArsA/GET3 family ATPase
MLVPRSGCDFCEKRRASQIKHAAALENLDSNLKVTHLPFLPGEVRGRKQLEHVAGMLF